jgi:RNA polymerase sigma-70 factor (ECF subfamily)
MFITAQIGRRSRHSELPDEQLMALVRDGDSGAFEIVFDRHGGVAFSLAYRMCGRRALAEDIVQEAFLSLWRTGARYDPSRGSVRSWVLSAVHNRAIDAFRRESIREGKTVADDGLSERIEEPVRTAEEVERRDEAREIRTALDSLPTEQRRVIELAYFGGFSHSEIAEQLGLPAGTVKGRMRLGLSKLRLVVSDPLTAL